MQMEAPKYEPKCITATFDGQVVVSKLLLFQIYLSQLIKRMHDKMTIEEPENLKVSNLWTAHHSLVLIPFF